MMNERIKQIADQCGLYIAYDNREVTNKELSFFAETIVQECIVDFYRRYLDICSDEDITVQVERYVKEYFGVEE